MIHTEIGTLSLLQWHRSHMDLLYKEGSKPPGKHYFSQAPSTSHLPIFNVVPKIHQNIVATAVVGAGKKVKRESTVLFTVITLVYWLCEVQGAQRHEITITGRCMLHPDRCRLHSKLSL